MRARHHQQWGEIARLQRLRVDSADLAVQRAAGAVNAASTACAAADDDVVDALTEWHAQLAKPAFDPLLHQGWHALVAQKATLAKTAASKLAQAEAELSVERQTWFRAERQYDLIAARQTTAKRAEARAHDDHAAMEAADLLGQHRFHINQSEQKGGMSG